MEEFIKYRHKRLLEARPYNDGTDKEVWASSFIKRRGGPKEGDHYVAREEGKEELHIVSKEYLEQTYTPMEESKPSGGTLPCWHCNHEMIWGADFSFEDYGIDDQEGIIATFSCSNCEATAEVRLPIGQPIQVKEES